MDLNDSSHLLQHRPRPGDIHHRRLGRHVMSPPAPSPTDPGPVIEFITILTKIDEAATPAVNFHVFGQVVGSGKGLATQGTLVRFDTGMTPPVAG